MQYVYKKTAILKLQKWIVIIMATTKTTTYLLVVENIHDPLS